MRSSTAAADRSSPATRPERARRLCGRADPTVARALSARRGRPRLADDPRRLRAGRARAARDVPATPSCSPRSTTPRRGRPQITERPVHASFLNRIPGAKRHYPKLLPLMNRAFRSFDLSGFDLVLSSSHACAKNVRTRPGTLHVCYCHTPMRYAWEEGFLEGEDVGRATRAAAAAAARAAAPPGPRRRGRPGRVRGQLGPRRRADRSATTAARRRSSTRRSTSSTSSAWSARPSDYYLAFGRVVPYKRVDLARRGLRAARPPAQGRRRRSRAGRRCAPRRGARASSCSARSPTASATRCCGGARALLFPGEEDFGIVPVEAQAAGVPVIAYGVGGASESVLDGVTGVLFAEQTPRPRWRPRSSASRGSPSTRRSHGGTPGASVASAFAPRWRRSSRAPPTWSPREKQLAAGGADSAIGSRGARACNG